MRQPLNLLAGLLLLFLISGCGGSGESVFVATGESPKGPEQGTGDLVFNFIQAQTEVPTGTTELKFEFLNEGNVVVLAQTVSFAPQIVVRNVPSSARRVVVTSLNVDGLPLALSTGPVSVLVNGEQTVELTTAPVIFQTLEVQPESLVLTIGDSQTFRLLGFFSNGRIADISIAEAEYGGNDTAVATVVDGVVTAVGPGSTTILVTYTLAGTSSSQTTEVPVVVAGPALELSGANTFDTDSGLFNGQLYPGWDGSTLHTRALNLPEGATLTVSGSAPLELRATGDIQIDGLLDASGQDGESADFANLGPVNNPNGDDTASLGGDGGPGGFAGGRSGGTDVMDQNGLAGLGPGAGQGAVFGGGSSSLGAMGGGGGHLTAGIDGSAENGTGGSGGAAYESIPNTLIGGSGGGGASMSTVLVAFAGGGGGGGGGAVRMTAGGNLVVGPTGVVDCSGGDGGGSLFSSAAGGAGSGGSIHLMGASQPIINGVLDVSGGVIGIPMFIVIPGGDPGPLEQSGADGRVLVETL